MKRLGISSPHRLRYSSKGDAEKGAQICWINMFIFTHMAHTYTHDIKDASHPKGMITIESPFVFASFQSDSFCDARKIEPYPFLKGLGDLISADPRAARGIGRGGPCWHTGRWRPYNSRPGDILGFGAVTNITNGCCSYHSMEISYDIMIYNGMVYAEKCGFV